MDKLHKFTRIIDWALKILAVPLVFGLMLFGGLVLAEVKKALRS